MSRVNDTVLLSGWLFADLLLALAVIFLIGNTAGIKPNTVLPTLIVTPAVLDANANTPGCIGGTSKPQCTVTVSEGKGASDGITWSVSSDISDAIGYTINNIAATGGNLAPGGSVSLTIAAIPCQNGSFTFSAVKTNDKKITISPVIVSWHCIPPQVKPERLDFNYKRFSLTVNDINAFLGNDPQQINDVKQQIMTAPILQGKNVGLAIVYGGTPDVDHIGQAQAAANEVYSILRGLTQNGFQGFARSSYYVPLYTLGPPQSHIDVDVYFIIRG